MRIRAFRPDDAQAVVALWERCDLIRPWNDPFRDIERKLRVQPELFLVGEIDGRVIGTAMAGFDGHRGWVNYLAVEPELQGQRLGTALVSAAEQRLRKLGCPKINVQIRRGNSAVVEFYEHLGFAEDEVVSMGKRLESDAMNYRLMAPGEERAVLELVLRSFDEAVRPDFSAAGVAEFVSAARGFLLDAPEGHVVHVAEREGEIVGMIDVRDSAHVCLFFVDSAYRRSGIGTTLLVAAIAAAQPEALTVNSAPSAVGAYEHFGFEATAPEQEKNGIRYVSMRKTLA